MCHSHNALTPVKPLETNGLYYCAIMVYGCLQKSVRSTTGVKYLGT